MIRSFASPTLPHDTNITTQTKISVCAFSLPLYDLFLSPLVRQTYPAPPCRPLTEAESQFPSSSSISQYPIDPVIVRGVTMLFGIHQDQPPNHHSSCSLLSEVRSKTATSPSLRREVCFGRTFSLALNIYE